MNILMVGMNVLLYGLLGVCLRQSGATYILDEPLQDPSVDYDYGHCDLEDDHPDCPGFKELCDDVEEVRQLCPHTCDSCQEVIEKEEEMAKLDEALELFERANAPQCNDTMVSCPQMANECISRVQIRRLCAHTCNACKELRHNKKGRLSTSDTTNDEDKQYICPTKNLEDEPTVEQLIRQLTKKLELKLKFPSL